MGAASQIHKNSPKIQKDSSHIRPSISGADTSWIQHSTDNQHSEHEATKFEDNPGNSDDEDDEKHPNESDFDAEPRINDQHPSTPDDSSGSEWEVDSEEESGAVGETIYRRGLACEDSSSDSFVRGASIDRGSLPKKVVDEDKKQCYEKQEGSE